VQWGVSQKLKVWASTRAQVAERVADVTLTVNTACGWTEQNRTERQCRDVPVRRSKTWASACAQVVARLADVTLAVHPNLHQVGLPGTHPPPHTIITSCSTTKRCAIPCPPTLPNTHTYHQRASRVAASTSRCDTHCPQHPPSQYASSRTICVSKLPHELCVLTLPVTTTHVTLTTRSTCPAPACITTIHQSAFCHMHM
jgi:hypothetical protein